MSITAAASASSAPAATSSLFPYTGDYSSDLFGTSTSSAAASTYTGDDGYVFPNGNYISRFYRVSSQYSGLTPLDIDLYNYCYLPYNSLSYNKRDASSTSANTPTPRPTYLIDEAPCKRQAAINANCYWQNTNNTFQGLVPYSDPQSDDAFAQQQTCYCSTYPFFDSVLGCQACFDLHGGREGFHWFPAAYVSAASSSYCSARPATTDFENFVSSWAATQTQVQIVNTTASNVLGTQTAMSAYYTYSTETASVSSRSKNAAGSSRSNDISMSLLPVYLLLRALLPI